MKIIPKFRLTVAIALTVPVLACAATYDDLINSAKMGDTRERKSLPKARRSTQPISMATRCSCSRPVTGMPTPSTS